MALPGRKANEGQPVRHRVKPRHEWTEIPDAPFKGGPDLPKAQPGQPSWPTATKRWWKAVSSLPQCVLWNDGDWAFALDTALVAAEFHRGHITAASELRLRERMMGTTFDSRRDLRIRYVPAEAEEERAGPTAIEDYRQRLEG